jgi:hypothetical protein
MSKPKAKPKNKKRQKPGTPGTPVFLAKAVYKGVKTT